MTDDILIMLVGWLVAGRSPLFLVFFPLEGVCSIGDVLDCNVLACRGRLQGNTVRVHFISASLRC